jgi:hypothetical protein
MLQHFVNVSYLLSTILVITMNPLLTTALLVVLYMRGEIGQLAQPLLTGLISLSEISIYIIPIVMAVAIFTAIVSNAAKHPLR